MTAVVASCGNYSNEDLLYMSAVPSSSQLAVVLPAAATTVTQAELAQDTHNGISNVNTLLDDVLGLDRHGPRRTSRPAGRPTAGPGARSTIRTTPAGDGSSSSRCEANGTTFDYHLDVENTKAAAPAWVEFLTGFFDLAGGVKQGNGAVTANFAALANAAFPLDDSSKPLTTLTLSYQNYQTPGSPVSVTLQIERTPDANGVTSAKFMYKILTDGSGEIAFTLVGNVVPGPRDRDADPQLRVAADRHRDGDPGRRVGRRRRADPDRVLGRDLRDDLQRQTLVDRPRTSGTPRPAPSFLVSSKISDSYVGLDPRCDVVVPYGLTHRGRRTILAEHFRRIDPRYERQLEVEVMYEGKKQTSQTRNISLGGLYLDSLTSLPIGTTVQLRFTLPTQPEPVEVAGDVRWVVKKGTSDASGIGIRFQGSARQGRLGPEPLLPERHVVQGPFEGLSAARRAAAAKGRLCT